MVGSAPDFQREPDVYLMLCAQRTGSGALGSLLGKHPDVVYWGEIFHPSDSENDFNFFNYLETTPEAPMTYLRCAEKQEFFDTYVEDMSRESHASRQLLDVKYDSTHHLNNAFHSQGLEPGLIRWIRARDVPVIHLTRVNFLRTFVSAQLSQASGVWHTASPTSGHRRKVTVSLEALDRHLAWSSRSMAQMSEHLLRVPRVLSVEYSAMYSTHGLLTDVCAKELEDFLSLNVGELTTLQPAWAKQTPEALFDVIANFDEVAEHLVGTENMWMLIE